MARVKGAMMTRKRRNKTLKLAKSYWGSKSRHFKMAKQAVAKSGVYAYVGRKLKTHSGAKKRFNLTKSGKVKRAHAFKSHILTKKTTKRTRNLRKNGYADVTVEDIVKKMIPYK